MTKPNFAAMTKRELRTYVLEHREDTEAFEALMDKLNAEPRTRVRSPEHLAELIEDRRRASEQQP